MAKSKIKRYYLPDTPDSIEKINHGFDQLGLPGMKSSVQRTSDEALERNLTPLDFIENLLKIEIDYQEEDRVKRWLAAAKFPWIKTLKDFDFSYPKSLDQRRIFDLASCRFAVEGKNIAFFGNPGVGKTHLSVAIAYEAIHKGIEVKFFTLENLIEQIERFASRGNLPQLQNNLTRLEILILDEMDLIKVDSEASDLLAKLLVNRYDKKLSTIFTSNKLFSEWESILGDRVRAGKIIDRISERCEIIKIEGDSYRVKDRVEALQDQS